jgi:hypothetical protein
VKANRARRKTPRDGAVGTSAVTLRADFVRDKIREFGFKLEMQVIRAFRSRSSRYSAAAIHSAKPRDVHFEPM